MILAIFLLFALVFWSLITLTFAYFTHDLTNPFPSSKAIGIFKKMIQTFRSFKPNEHQIGPTKFVRIHEGREISIVYGDKQIFFTEDEGKMLTLHLLAVYPELDQIDPEFDKQFDAIMEQNHARKENQVQDTAIEQSGVQNGSKNQRIS